MAAGRSLRVLVTDAAQRVALEVVRCLGRAGHHVLAVERREVANVPTFASSYCTDRARPEAGEAHDDFLLRLAADVDVVIPISTNSVVQVADRLGEFLGRCNLLVPEGARVREVMGKESIVAAAERAGVPVPRTARPRTEAELAACVGDVGLPAIVKLADDEGLYLSPAERYGLARTESELLALWRRLAAIKPAPVVQQRIVGPGIGFSTVLGNSSEPLGMVGHRRIREYPISGGPSTCCVSMEDEQLTRQSLDLLRSLGWVGPAMVEYKRDRRDGSYRLLEVNPRFWGSLPLARLAGLNLPAALVEHACDGTVPTELTATPGVKMRILPKDVLAGAGYLIAGDVRPFAGFLLDLVDPRVKPGLFDRTDPKPAFLFR